MMYIMYVATTLNLLLVSTLQLPLPFLLSSLPSLSASLMVSNHSNILMDSKERVWGGERVKCVCWVQIYRKYMSTHSHC